VLPYCFHGLNILLCHDLAFVIHSFVYMSLPSPDKIDDIAVKLMKTLA
jgi:hypothetical protein